MKPFEVSDHLCAALARTLNTLHERPSDKQKEMAENQLASLILGDTGIPALEDLEEKAKQQLFKKPGYQALIKALSRLNVEQFFSLGKYLEDLVAHGEGSMIHCYFEQLNKYTPQDIKTILEKEQWVCRLLHAHNDDGLLKSSNGALRGKFWAAFSKLSPKFQFELMKTSSDTPGYHSVFHAFLAFHHAPNDQVANQAVSQLFTWFETLSPEQQKNLLFTDYRLSCNNECQGNFYGVHSSIQQLKDSSEHQKRYSYGPPAEKRHYVQNSYWASLNIAAQLHGHPEANFSRFLSAILKLEQNPRQQDDWLARRVLPNAAYILPPPEFRARFYTAVARYQPLEVVLMVLTSIPFSHGQDDEVQRTLDFKPRMLDIFDYILGQIKNRSEQARGLVSLALDPRSPLGKVLHQARKGWWNRSKQQRAFAKLRTFIATVEPAPAAAGSPMRALLTPQAASAPEADNIANDAQIEEEGYPSSTAVPSEQVEGAPLDAVPGTATKTAADIPAAPSQEQLTPAQVAQLAEMPSAPGGKSFAAQDPCQEEEEEEKDSGKTPAYS